MVRVMRRTTAHRQGQLDGALGRAAAATGCSEADLLRADIGRVAGRPEPPKPRLPSFDSDDPALAARADDLLDGFGEM